MDFSVLGSDSWSSSIQEQRFINKYFKKSEGSTGTASERDRVRKPKEKKKKLKPPSTTEIVVPETKPFKKVQSHKPSVVSPETDKSSKTKCLKGLEKKNSVISGADAALNNALVKHLSEGKVENDISVSIAKRQKLQRSISVNEATSSETSINKGKKRHKPLNSKQESTDTYACSPKKCKLKAQNLKKLAEKTDEDVEVHSSKEKKVKHPKQNHLQKKSSDDVTDTNDNEDEIRNELKSFNFFKKLQKLVELEPSLNPSYCHSSDSENDDQIPSVSLETDTAQNESASSIEQDTDDSSGSDIDFTDAKARDSHSSVKKEDSDSEMESPHLSTRNDPIFDEYDSRRNLMLQSSKKSKAPKDLSTRTKQSLQAAKFRYLNEKLYTETGQSAFQYFKENPEEYEDYHMGYSLQVSKWPINPVDKIIEELKELKRGTVIADLGCGDAKIARTLNKHNVHSFDLRPLHSSVISCDISKVPLPRESVDVAVFCLSLMGTNLKDYLREAYRILKLGGLLKVAEVESRIPDVDSFIKGLKAMGFRLLKKNEAHRLFLFFNFKKDKKKLNAVKIPEILLKPCLYKKR